MNKTFHNKVILVTGACGTVGREIVKQLLLFDSAEIRIFDNNESELFMLNESYSNQNKLSAYYGDIRDEDKLKSVANGVDILLHCAALKHVFFYEHQPFEAVQTNIIGVKNIVKAALEKKVKLVIFTSSDKAVNPTNVMGTSKLMGERLITAANLLNGNNDQKFSSVRFGNVLGSRGSVLKIFQDQIRMGGPVTVTDRAMTRFVMTIERAAQLVLQGATLACGGEVMVTKMVSLAIIDLAEAMIELLAPRYSYDPSSINIDIIGAKPGEKLYEELMSQEEVARSLEIEDMFMVLPAARNIYRNIKYLYSGENKPVERPYVSNEEPLLTKEKIKELLLNNNLLSEDITGSSMRE